VIQGGAEMLDCLNREKVESAWNGFDQAALVRLSSAIRIRLGKEDIWAAFPEGASFDLEYVEMFFCAPDADFGAQVRVFHDLLQEPNG
jgi:hypothetical protein